MWVTSLKLLVTPWQTNHKHDDIFPPWPPPFRCHNITFTLSPFYLHFLGDFAANHAKERVKRRKSLTKLSINELGVDDTHPWLPRSPNPLTPPAEHHDKSPRSPSGQSPRSGGSGSAKLGSKEDPNRNLFFENVKPTDSTNEKLECMDRTSFRRLMDDLDNITIQEPMNNIFFFQLSPRKSRFRRLDISKHRLFRSIDDSENRNYLSIRRQIQQLTKWLYKTSVIRNLSWSQYQCQESHQSCHHCHQLIRQPIRIELRLHLPRKLLKVQFRPQNRQMSLFQKQQKALFSKIKQFWILICQSELRVRRWRWSWHVQNSLNPHQNHSKCPIKRTIENHRKCHQSHQFSSASRPNLCHQKQLNLQICRDGCPILGALSLVRTARCPAWAPFQSALIT